MNPNRSLENLAFTLLEIYHNYVRSESRTGQTNQRIKSPKGVGMGIDIVIL